MLGLSVCVGCERLVLLTENTISTDSPSFITLVVWGSHVPDSWMLILFYFTFFNCIVPMGIFPWEIRVAFPRESQLRQSRAIQPTVHAGCFSISIIHRTLVWTTGSLMFAQMLMHSTAHRGCTDTVRESAWKLTLGEKSLAAPGNRTCVSGVPVRCSINWAASPPEDLIQHVAFVQTAGKRHFPAHSYSMYDSLYLW